jgi:hypothetical protein
MTIIAYQLSPSTDHLPKRRTRGDIQRYDALVYPEGSLQRWDFISSSEYIGITPINFLGWLKQLSKTDYPHNAPGIPLMSMRMLEVLTGVGDFPHQAIPTRIFDYDVNNEVYLLQYQMEQSEIEIYLNSQNFGVDTYNSNHFAVKFLEHTDVIDRDRSEFTRYESDPPDLPPVVTHLVMREPAQGFPPIFRIEGDPVFLFVSPTAKEALEQAGIKGLRFLAYHDDGTTERVEPAVEATRRFGNS